MKQALDMHVYQDRAGYWQARVDVRDGIAERYWYGPMVRLTDLLMSVALDWCGLYDPFKGIDKSCHCPTCGNEKCHDCGGPLDIGFLHVQFREDICSKCQKPELTDEELKEIFETALDAVYDTPDPICSVTARPCVCGGGPCVHGRKR